MTPDGVCARQTLTSSRQACRCQACLWRAHFPASLQHLVGGDSRNSQAPLAPGQAFPPGIPARVPGVFTAQEAASLLPHEQGHWASCASRRGRPQTCAQARPRHPRPRSVLFQMAFCFQMELNPQRNWSDDRAAGGGLTGVLCPESKAVYFYWLRCNWVS